MLDDLIESHGVKAVIGQLKDYCDYMARVGPDNIDHAKAWDKLAYRLQGALDGMKRGQFGRVR